MIAKIVLDDREYFSYVYFLCIHDYRTKAIVFDSKENKFEFIDAFKNKYTSERVIYLFDFSEEGLEKKKKIKLTSYEVNDCIGYTWLINNIDLIEDIEQGKEVSEEYLKIARELNNTIDVYRWHDINNEMDAEELLDIAGAFHDSYIRDVKGIFGRPYEPEVETKFQVAFELYGNHFDILLEFIGGADIKYALSPYLNYIYLSSIIFHNDLIYWVDGGDDLRVIDIPDNPYICAKKLRWKIIDKKEDE